MFNSEKAKFAGAVFSSLPKARKWISSHKLSGLLTAYPIDIGVYNWFPLTDAKDLNAGGINYVDESLIIYPNKEKFKFKDMIREVLSRPE